MEIQRYYKLYEIAHHLDVEVEVLLESSKNIRTNEHCVRRQIVLLQQKTYICLQTRMHS